MFQEIPLSELETRHPFCECERTQILQSLSLAVSLCRIYVIRPNYITQKIYKSKKLQPIRKGPFQFIDKPTNVTYKTIDSNKKEIVQHQKNLLPNYPKEHALRELTQLYSLRELKIVHDKSDAKNE